LLMGVSDDYLGSFAAAFWVFAGLAILIAVASLWATPPDWMSDRWRTSAERDGTIVMTDEVVEERYRRLDTELAKMHARKGTGSVLRKPAWLMVIVACLRAFCIVLTMISTQRPQPPTPQFLS